VGESVGEDFLDNNHRMRKVKDLEIIRENGDELAELIFENCGEYKEVEGKRGEKIREVELILHLVGAESATDLPLDDIIEDFEIEIVSSAGSQLVEGNLEGSWNNGTATLEFPETALSGSTMKTSTGEDVTVSGADHFALAKGGTLELAVPPGGPPERGVCKAAAKGAGKFLNALCTEPGEKGGAKKEFVWVPQAKATAFTSTTGEATLKSYTPEGAELPPVTCKKSKGKGKALTSTTSESVVTFEECSSSGEKCTGGTKAKAGQIITKTLDGLLGTIAGGTKVGEAVGGAGLTGITAEFKCGANEIKTEGATIGEVAPVDAKAATTSTLTFAAGVPPAQEWTELSGKPYSLKTEINGLGAGTFPFPSVEITKATVKGTAYEINTVV
jgi:hypothetical protein